MQLVRQKPRMVDARSLLPLQPCCVVISSLLAVPTRCKAIGQDPLLTAKPAGMQPRWEVSSRPSLSVRGCVSNGIGMKFGRPAREKFQKGALPDQMADMA